MLTIYKGDKTARVPSGSFKSLFAPYGWSTTPPKKGRKPPKDRPKPDPGSQAPVEEDGSTAPVDGSTEDGEDLSKMSDEALKQYASLLGVKTKSLKSREDILKAIEAAQK